jgi:hypothetical protein
MISGTGSRGIGVSTITSGDPYFRLYNNTTIVGDMWWGRSGSYQGINSLGAGSITAINPFGGNVGVGTINPSAKIHVLGSVGGIFDGQASSTYTGGGQPAVSYYYGDAFGNGAPYGTSAGGYAAYSVWRGGGSGGYFQGGAGDPSPGGGGAGIVAIGGAGSTYDGDAKRAEGGAGIFARGGLNGDGSTRTWAGYFDGRIAVSSSITAGSHITTTNGYMYAAYNAGDVILWGGIGAYANIYGALSWDVGKAIIKGRAGYGLGMYADDNLSKGITLATTGAATFSNSVTATGFTTGTSGGSSVNITTNGNNGTSGNPLQTNVNFYGYNGNLNGQIRVDDIAGTAQLGSMKFYTWNSGQVLGLTLSHTGAATFNSSIYASSSITSGGNISGLDITGSLFQTSTSSVSSVGTSFVNSGTSFGNTTGVWLVSITAFGDGNMYSAALYVVTTAAYSKTLDVIGGPSNHFGNGFVVAELSTTDGVSADLRVRRTSVGSATVYVKIMKIGS